MGACTNFYYSGQGIFYVGDRNAQGGPDGLRPVGNVPAMEISIDVTKFEHKEACSGLRATDLTLVQDKTVNFSMTLENASAANLALALWGETAVITGAAVATESHIARMNKVEPLANINLDSGVAPVVTDTATGLITYVDGTDYTIDYVNGNYQS